MAPNPTPACILIPATEATFHDHLLQGSESRHFITNQQFKQWSKSHPEVELRPQQQQQQQSTTAGSSTAPQQQQQQQQQQATSQVASTTNNAGTTKSEPYKAPQHPTSHMLQSIPPRAPSQSSRSNILSYTLHLATSARLASYSHPNGSQSLLYRAESTTTTNDAPSIDTEWLESELKAQGMWRLGASLLKSNRKEGHLPPSVERRVTLASLTEDLLVHPSSEEAFSNIKNQDQVVDSVEVEGLNALKPLTSPDTTKLYLTTSTTSSKVTAPSSSVAQSLIDLKFGGAASSSSSMESTAEEVKNELQDGSALFGGGGGGDGGATGTINGSSTSQATAAPHMDYRIVRQQNMRTRAKSIYSNSILPSSSTSFCRRHRVGSCSVCMNVSETKLETRRKAIPGQGLEVYGGELVGGKRPLVELVPKFLDFSAHLLRDVQEKLSPPAHEEGSDDDEEENDGKGKGKRIEPVEMQATASWYALLHSLLTQACLEGYLVDGWTGTSGIETLFGVGCGVWEGRGWAKRIDEQRRAEEEALQAAKNNETGSHVEVVEGEDFEEDDDEEDGSDDDDESEEREIRLETERERTKLVDAAQQLFGSRDIAQAEFERSMRDRIHEFLNVPEGSTLENHLLTLNAKYPLSSFETEMVDFLESTTRLLGKPALAKYETTSSSASSTSNTNEEPDPFALNKYFTRVEPSGLTTPQEYDTETKLGLIEEQARDYKRRKVD